MLLCIDGTLKNASGKAAASEGANRKQFSPAHRLSEESFPQAVR